MKSLWHGKSTSEAEVQDISKNGIWLHVKGKEYFLPYEKFPWFEDAKPNAILNVEFRHGFHLYWPQLDVDLHLESLEHPEKYPLVYTPNRSRRPIPSVKESKQRRYGKKK